MDGDPKCVNALLPAPVEVVEPQGVGVDPAGASWRAELVVAVEGTSRPSKFSESFRDGVALRSWGHDILGSSGLSKTVALEAPI